MGLIIIEKMILTIGLLFILGIYTPLGKNDKFQNLMAGVGVAMVVIAFTAFVLFFIYGIIFY